MKIRLLIDEDMPRSAGKALAAAGFETQDVRDIGLRGAKDQVILEYACRHAGPGQPAAADDAPAFGKVKQRALKQVGEQSPAFLFSVPEAGLFWEK